MAETKDEKDRAKLYDALYQEYPDLGDWKTFNAKLDDEGNRRKLYEAVKRDFDDAGTWDDFNARLKPAQAVQQVQTAGQQVAGAGQQAQQPQQAQQAQQAQRTQQRQQAQKPQAPAPKPRIANPEKTVVVDGVKLRYVKTEKGITFNGNDYAQWCAKTGAQMGKHYPPVNGSKSVVAPGYVQAAMANPYVDPKIFQQYGQTNATHSTYAGAGEANRKKGEDEWKASIGQMTRQAAAQAARSSERGRQATAAATQKAQRFDAVRTLKGLDAQDEMELMADENGQPVLMSNRGITDIDVETTDENGNPVTMYAVTDRDGNVVTYGAGQENEARAAITEGLDAQQRARQAERVAREKAMQTYMDHEPTKEEYTGDFKGYIQAVQAYYTQKTEEYDQRIKYLQTASGFAKGMPIEVGGMFYYDRDGSDNTSSSELDKVRAEKEAFQLEMAQRHPDVMSTSVLDAIKHYALSDMAAVTQLKSDIAKVVVKGSKYERKVSKAAYEFYKTEANMIYAGSANEWIEKAHSYGGMAAIGVASALGLEAPAAMIGGADLLRMVTGGAAAQGQQARQRGASNAGVLVAEAANALIWSVAGHYMGKALGIFGQRTFRNLGASADEKLAMAIREELEKGGANAEKLRAYLNSGKMEDAVARQFAGMDANLIKQTIWGAITGTASTAGSMGVSTLFSGLIPLVDGEDVEWKGELKQAFEQTGHAMIDGAIMGLFFSGCGSWRQLRAAQSRPDVQPLKGCEDAGREYFSQTRDGMLVRIIGAGSKEGMATVQLGNGRYFEIPVTSMSVPWSMTKGEFHGHVQRLLREDLEMAKEDGSKLTTPDERAMARINWQDAQTDMRKALGSFTPEEREAFVRGDFESDVYSDEHRDAIHAYQRAKNVYDGMFRAAEAYRDQKFREFNEKTGKIVYKDGNWKPGDPISDEAQLIKATYTKGVDEPREVYIVSGYSTEPGAVVQVYDIKTGETMPVVNSDLAGMSIERFGDVKGQKYAQLQAEMEREMQGFVDGHLKEGAEAFPVVIDGVQQKIQYVGTRVDDMGRTVIDYMDEEGNVRSTTRENIQALYSQVIYERSEAYRYREQYEDMEIKRSAEKPEQMSVDEKGAEGAGTAVNGSEGAVATEGAAENGSEVQNLGAGEGAAGARAGAEIEANPYAPGRSFSFERGGRTWTMTIDAVDEVKGTITATLTDGRGTTTQEMKIDVFMKNFSQEAIEAERQRIAEAQRLASEGLEPAGEGAADAVEGAVENGREGAVAVEGAAVDGSEESVAGAGEGAVIPAEESAGSARADEAPAYEYEKEEIPVVTDANGRQRKQYHMVSAERTLEDIAGMDGYAGRTDMQQKFVGKKLEQASNELAEHDKKKPTDDAFEDPEDYSQALAEWKSQREEISQRKSYWERVKAIQDNAILESNRVTVESLRKASTNEERADVARSLKIQADQFTDKQLMDRARNLSNNAKRTGDAASEELVNIYRTIAEQRGIADEFDAHLESKYSHYEMMSAQMAVGEMGDVTPENVAKVVTELAGKVSADHVRELIDAELANGGKAPADWEAVDAVIAEQKAAAQKAAAEAEEKRRAEKARRDAKKRAERAEYGEPQSAEEFVAINLPKLDPEDVRKQTGYGTKEQKNYGAIFANPENGGVGVERAAEILAATPGAENWFPMDASTEALDTMAIRDILIDFLSHGKHPRTFVKENREAMWKEQIDEAREGSYEDAMEEDLGKLQQTYLRMLKEHNAMMSGHPGYKNTLTAMKRQAELEGMERAIKERGGTLPDANMAKTGSKKVDYSKFGDVDLYAEHKRMKDEYDQKKVSFDWLRSKAGRELAKQLEAIEAEIDKRNAENKAPFSTREGDETAGEGAETVDEAAADAAGTAAEVPAEVKVELGEPDIDGHYDVRSEAEKAMTPEELQNRKNELEHTMKVAQTDLETARKDGFFSLEEVDEAEDAYIIAKHDYEAFCVRNKLYGPGLHTNGNMITMTAGERKFWDSFAKDLGMPLIITDMLRPDEYGRSRVNGMYVDSEGAVWIAADAVGKRRNQEFMSFAAGHETTHMVKARAKRNGSADWDLLVQSVREEMGNNFDVEMAIEFGKNYQRQVEEFMERPAVAKAISEGSISREEALKLAHDYADKVVTDEYITEEVVANHIGRKFKVVSGEDISKNRKAMLATSEETAEIWSKMAQELENGSVADEAAEKGASFSIVRDPELIKKLDSEETTDLYHAMQLVEMPDGKKYLFPPMAKKHGKQVVEGIPVAEDGTITPTWEQADENPDLAFRMTAGEHSKKIPNDAELEIREDGYAYYNNARVKGEINPETGEFEPSWYFTLKKDNKGESGKKLTDLGAVLYDPYQHSGFNAVNDQFTTAYDWPHLVIVKVKVPNSELTGKSGYRAEKAGLGVGTHEWTGGKLKTSKRREVGLSRWDKPYEIMSDAEVAKAFKQVLDENGLTEVPFNIVTPAQREELVKIGVKIGEPTSDNGGQGAREAYEAWKSESNYAEKRSVTGDEIFVSDKNAVDDPNDGVTINGNHDVVSVEQPGEAQFSIRTYEEGGRDAFHDFLDKQVEKGILDKENAEYMRDMMEEQYKIAKELYDSGDYESFNIWSDAPIITTKSGHVIYTVIKPNNEYGMNLDFSLICKKRRTLDKVLNEMIDRGLIDSMTAGNDDISIARINDIIREYGFETACKLCFVDAKRFRQAKVADDFVQLYNGLVNKIIPRGSKIKADFFDFADYGHPTNDNALHTVDEASIEAGLDKVRRIVADEDKRKGDSAGRTVTYKIAKHLLEHPEDRKLLQRGDFMSSKGFDGVNINNESIIGLYNSKKGSGGPKAAESDVQYLNDVARANWSPEKAYKVGGVRVQSFSDYVPHLVLDYMQMFSELAASKLPAHAYTKEELFAKLFGKTGIKINLSLVPGVVEGGKAAGLDANGEYVWERGETFPYEIAVELQNAEGYRENVGTIAVGVSDEHIMKMMADPNIRMIIPYHKSGINRKIAVYNGIHKFTDYTNVQNTRYKATGKKLSKSDHEKELTFEDYLAKTGDPNKAAEAYVRDCEKNGWLPKFDKFLEKDADGKYIITDGYYKLLEDFTTYVPNAEGGFDYFPQREVRMDYPKDGDQFGSMRELMERGLEEDNILDQAQKREVSPIVDQIERELGLSRMGDKFSTRKVADRDKVKWGDMSQKEVREFISHISRTGKATNNITMEEWPMFIYRANGIANRDWLTGSDGVQSNVVTSVKPVADSTRIDDVARGSNRARNLSNADMAETAYKELKDMLDIVRPWATSAVQREMDRVLEDYRHDIELLRKLGRGIDALKDDDFRRFITRSTNFKRWFGDWENDPENASKVVDENGRPQLLYHGTPEPGFSEFERDEANGYGAFWASTSESHASRYGHYGKESGETYMNNVYPLFADVKNPIDVGYVDENCLESESFQKICETFGMTPEELMTACDVWEWKGNIGYETRVAKHETHEDAVEAALMSTPLYTLTRSKGFADLLRERGYDGIKAVEFNRADNSRVETWGVLDSNQFKSAIANNGDYSEHPDIRFSASVASSDPFYSNAAKAVEGVKQEKATADQWMAMLKKSGGLKAEEDKWMRLGEWLEGEKAKAVMGIRDKAITKQEVEEYIAQNAVKVEEHTYSEHGINDIKLTPAEEAECNAKAIEQVKSKEFRNVPIELQFDDTGKLLLESQEDIESLGTYFAKVFNERITKKNTVEHWANVAKDNIEMRYRIHKRNAEEQLKSKKHHGVINDTRLDNTTRGLKNNREIALTVPTIEPYNANDEIHFGDAGGGRAVAWSRFGETTDADGNRVLVIDEVQSKRHQDGREKGYKSNEYTEFKQKMREKYGPNFLAKMTNDEASTYSSLIGKVDSVSDAPFQKNWHELAMKRMLRLAAEEGYDKVAWTKGQQQAERYGLGRVVDLMTVDPAYEVTDTGEPLKEVTLYMNNGELALYVDQEGTVKDYEGRSPGFSPEGKNLAEIVGKENAEKLLRAEEFTKLDKSMFIGGTGMKAFYDNMLPSFMNKYGKKWGVKVGEVELPDVEEAGRTMWAVDVTPEMKESVMGGQPLFSARNPQERLQRINREYEETSEELKRNGVSLDAQGNPIETDGKFIVDSFDSAISIPNEDFIRPYRNVELPPLTSEVDEKIGGNGRRVLIKRNVFKKNAVSHAELDISDNGELLNSALTETEEMINDKPSNKPNYWILTKLGERSAVANIDVDPEKSHIELVGWRFVNDKGISKIKARAIREGGQILITNSGAADLSALQYGSYNGKGTNINREMQENEAENIEKFSVAGLRGMQNLDKTRGTSTMASLNVALDMEKQFGAGITDEDRRKIKLATGWERDGGQWKHELPDLWINRDAFDKLVSSAELPDKVTLADIANAEELFDAYPRIKSMRVNIDKTGKVLNAFYDPKRDDITISAKALKAFGDDSVMRDRNIDSLEDMLIHEVQHAIQEREGFATGGGLYSRQIAIDGIMSNLSFINDEARKWYMTLPEEEAAEVREYTDDLKDDVELMSIYLDEEDPLPSSTMNDIREELMRARELRGMSDIEYYKRLGGEVEARNAERRNGMSTVEKQNSLLSDTADVPEEKVEYEYPNYSGLKRLRVEDMEAERKRLQAKRERGFADADDKAIERKRAAQATAEALSKRNGVEVKAENGESPEEVTTNWVIKSLDTSNLREMLGSSYDHYLGDLDAEEVVAKLGNNAAFAEVDEKWWKNVKDNLTHALLKAGVDLPFELTDADARYILWKNARENNGDILSKAAEIDMRRRLGVGEFMSENTKVSKRMSSDYRTIQEQAGDTGADIVRALAGTDFGPDVKFSVHPFDEIPSFDEPVPPRIQPGESIESESYKERLAAYQEAYDKWLTRDRGGRGIVLSDADLFDAVMTGDTSKIDEAKADEDWQLEQLMLESEHIIKVSQRQMKRAIFASIIERRKAIETSNFDDATFIHDIIDRTTKEQRKAIPYILEGETDTGVEMTPELQQVVEDIRSWFDEQHARMEEEGLFSKDEKNHYLKNYVTHIWDRERSDKKGLAILENRMRLNSPYTEHRVIKSLREGIELGLVPKHEDIVGIMAEYGNYLNETIANRHMLKDLEGYEVTWTETANDGTEIEHSQPLLKEVDTTDREYVVIDNNALRGKSVWAPLAPMMNVVFGPTRTKGVKEGFRKAAHIYDVVGGLQKKINLALSFFHHAALTETAVGAMNPYGALKTVFKNIIWDAALNRQNGEFKPHSPAFNNPELTRDAVEHLVQLGATNDYAAKDIQAVTEKLKKFAEEHNADGVLGKLNPAIPITKIIDFVNKGMDTVLWDYLHDGLKLYTYEKMSKEIRRKAQKQGLDEATVDKLLDEAGQFINDTYGGQHWDVLGYSPQTVKWMRRLLLSPDWTLSTLRQAMAPFGFGQLYEDRTLWERFVKASPEYEEITSPSEKQLNSMIRKSRAKHGAAFWAWAMATFIAGYNALNAYNRKKDVDEQNEIAEQQRLMGDKDYKSMYELAYPDGMKWYDYTFLGNTQGNQTLLFMGRMDNGLERYARWGKQFRELPELFYGHDGLSIPFAAANKISGKLNPVLNTLSNVLFGKSINGWENDIMKGTKGFERTWAATQVLLKSFTPYSLPGDEDMEFIWTDLFMPSKKGFSWFKAKQGFVTAIQSGDKDLVKKIYQACVLNGLKPDEILNTAFNEVKQTARKDLLGIDPETAPETAMAMYDKATTVDEKRKLKSYIDREVQEENYKPITLDEILERASENMQGRVYSEQNDDEYVLHSKWKDIAEDARLKNAKKNMEAYYKEHKELEKTDAQEARQYAKDNKKQLALYDEANSLLREISALKKEMHEKGYSDELMEKIRKARTKFFDKHE